MYDQNGSFEFDFSDDNTGEWHVAFAQGIVAVCNHSGSTRFSVIYPKEDHWTYTGKFSREEDGDRMYCAFMGAQIKNDHFTLAVSLQVEECEPYDDKAEALLQLDTNSVSVEVFIPGKLGFQLMCFMAGSTNLDGVHNVHRS